MRVVIGEDQESFRDALAHLLSGAGHDVVGVAGDGPGLVLRALAERPQLVIADVRMPPTQHDEGLRAARAIRAEAPEIAVLIISHHLQLRYAIELLSENARGVGYLLKQRVGDVGRFLAALDTIRGGGIVIDAEVVAVMMMREPALAAGDLELLGLIAEGRTDASIAASLEISEAEVVRRTSDAFAAIGAHGMR